MLSGRKQNDFKNLGLLLKMAFCFKLVYCVSRILIFLSLAACNKEVNTSSQSLEKSQLTPELLAVEKYQTKCQCVLNKTQTHTLCHTPLQSKDDGSLSFFVFDNEKRKIIYEDARVRSVSWVTNQKIKILPFVGMPSNEMVDFYYYHLLTGIVKSDEPRW